MESHEQNKDRLVAGLRDGDPEAVREFCLTYGPVLQRIADRRIAGALRRRLDAEDVVQSACRTFVRRAAGGEFRLDDAEGMWRLLCAITLSKVREQARHHLRKKRGLDREEQPAEGSSGVDFSPADPGPGPADAAEFADGFETLMESLDRDERRVVDLKLQDLTNDEIAAKLACSERTVRRLLKQVRDRCANPLAE